MPTAGLTTDMFQYWNLHHTPADTFDKVDRVRFGKCVAALAILAATVGNDV